MGRGAATHGGCAKKLWWFIMNQISTTIATSRKFTRGSGAGAGRDTGGPGSVMVTQRPKRAKAPADDLSSVMIDQGELQVAANGGRGRGGRPVRCQRGLRRIRSATG